MRWTRSCRKACDAIAYGQAVWSWHLDAGVKFSEMRCRPRGRHAEIGERRWLKSPTHRGERGAAVKPLRRECRSDFGVPVLASRASFSFCTQGSGCVVHPAFPAPSAFWRDTDNAKPGRICAAGTVKRVFNFRRHSGAPRSGEPGTHNHHREYGFRARAFGASRNDEDKKRGSLRSSLRRSAYSNLASTLPNPCNSITT